MDSSDIPAGSTGSEPPFPPAAGRDASTPAPKRRPGRPRRSEGPAVSREAIVHEALLALTTNGPAGFALRDIARRLGVALPTLQRHFPTKDDLWRACVDKIVDTSPISADNDIAGDAAPLLSNFVRHLIDRTTLYPRATAAMWSDSEPGAEGRLNYLLDRMRPFYGTAKQNLNAAIAVGVFREVDVDVFLALMSLGVSSIVSSRFALAKLFEIKLDREQDRQRLTQALSDILLNGIMTPDQAASERS